MHENIISGRTLKTLVEQRNILKFHLKIDRFKYHDRICSLKRISIFTIRVNDMKERKYKKRTIERQEGKNREEEEESSDSFVDN